jgi:type I restriction enzyme S subunit
MPVPSKFITCHTLGVAVQGINLRDVRRIPVAFPPIEEQSRIGDILDALDRKVSDECLYLDKLGLLKVGLMQDLLSGNTRVHTDPAEEATLG